MQFTAKALKVLLCAALGLAFSGPALAWNDRGHMTVAYIAYKQLTPTTRDRVNALLKLNPKYSDWSATVDKQVPGASADGSQNGNRPDGSPDPGKNTGYDDLLMHKYWHFIDTPFTTDGTALPPIPKPNAQERIALFRTVLASTSADPLKSYDLTWLLHLVGDVHQPLHASTRVGSTDRNGDSGGNLVKLELPELRVACLLGPSARHQQQLEYGAEGREKIAGGGGSIASEVR
jgi:hypothetical protein